MENKICEISISTSWLGDTYIFYEDNSIKRVFDYNSLSCDVTEWLKPKQISKNNKDKLIKKCPDSCKERIMLILDYP